MRAYVIIGTVLALAITPAVAGGKSGGGAHTSTQNHPQETMSLSYGKIEHTYTQQKPDGTAQATGKRTHKDITISKSSDKSSPKLIQQTTSKTRRSDGGGATVGR
jgi:type VI protein secretion system component Hcp